MKTHQVGDQFVVHGKTYLSVTGDCMARYRKDHTHIVFIEVTEGGEK